MAVIHATPQKTVKDMPGYTYLPSNATMLMEYRSSHGILYGFSGGNQSALILHVRLPSLILNEGSVLQDLNLSNVKFSLYSDYHGTDVFRISNASLASINPSGSNISGLIDSVPQKGDLGNLTLYVSDTVGSYIFVGTLSGVEECIDLADSGIQNSSVKGRISVDANLSAFAYLNSSNGAKSLSINSTGNSTEMKISFNTYTDFSLFKAEIIGLEVSSQLKNVVLTTSGLTVIIGFDLNLEAFSQFVADHSSLLKSLEAA